MVEGTNIATEIEQLDALRTKGLITTDQFEARKAALFASKPKLKPKRPGALLAMTVIVLSIIASAIYGGNAAVFFGALFGLFVYLLPGFIAFQRIHKQRNVILLINIFLGWSILAWVIALIWSFSNNREEEYA